MTTRSIWQRSRRDAAAKQGKCGQRILSEILLQSVCQPSERIPKKFYGGYERVLGQPIELRLFHRASLAQMGVTADAWKFLGASVFVRPGLFGQARHCAASPPGGLKLIRAQFARGAVLDCGLAQDALRANT